MYQKYTSEYINNIIATAQRNIIVKDFATNFVNNLLNTNFYDPKLLENDFYLTHLKHKDPKYINEICMICTDDINIELISYKCKKCTCFLHHSCANEYYSKYNVYECMQCKTAHNVQTPTSEIHFTWRNGEIITACILSQYEHFELSTTKIYYRSKLTKKLMKDLQIIITKDDEPNVMITVTANSDQHGCVNIYTATIYRYNENSYSLLVKQLNDLSYGDIIQLF